MSKTITFRGKLADEQIQRIKLSTLNGKTGYRVKKFETMVVEPGATSQISITKIYNTSKNAPADSIIDFDDYTLIAASMLQEAATTDRFDSETIIFDNMTFNQDIFITHKDYQSGEKINYYIELEVVNLSDVESTMLTLQSMRTVASGHQTP
tara:strand:+ start:475 stop:930 length:456 start_codon:yes stop_codon:yes gene_type:complete